MAALSTISFADLAGRVGSFNWLATGFARVRAAYRARRDLSALADFDDRMLRDIGLTRADIRDAVAQPLWNDPSTILVNRARERRRGAPRLPAHGAPPLAPIDSSGLFPARSPYF